MRHSTVRTAAAASAALALAAGTAAHAVVITETEANDSKATANVATNLTSGDTLVGNSTGSSTTVAGTTSADYFRLTTPTAPLGVYRNRLTLTTTGTAGHTGTIRGFTQATGVINTTSDATFQTSSTLVNGTTPIRTNVWYGFGKGETVNYRVTGGTTTTGDYTSTYEQTPVPVQTTGVTLGEGAPIRIAETSTNDGDFFVYDSNFEPVIGATVDSSVANGSDVLVRTLAAGTYYLVAGNFNTADDQPAPADDTFRSSNVTDGPDFLVNSSTGFATAQTYAFSNVGSTAVTTATYAKAGAFELGFLQFNVVVPEPTTLGFAALAGLPALLRRRAAK